MGSVQMKYTKIMSRYDIGQHIQYRGEWFRIQSFPDAHTILAINLAPTSELPQQVRILITEL